MVVNWSMIAEAKYVAFQVPRQKIQKIIIPPTYSLKKNYAENLIIVTSTLFSSPFSNEYIMPYLH